jgi:hypothetical protein
LAFGQLPKRRAEVDKPALFACGTLAFAAFNLVAVNLNTNMGDVAPYDLVNEPFIANLSL